MQDGRVPTLAMGPRLRVATRQYEAEAGDRIDD